MDVKEKALRKKIGGLGRVIVAFSGGVDSSVLAKIAHEELGDNAVAATLDSPTLSKIALAEAREVAASIGIRHTVLKHNELKNPDFARNPTDRCYHCKGMLSDEMRLLAISGGFNAIVEGTNADELNGHRPGFDAVKERGVLSPLAEIGFTKEEVRRLAKKLRLPVAAKPSDACLASRIPFGEEITPKKLERIEESEAYLKSLGIKQVRVRSHGDIARIEVRPDDFQMLLSKRQDVTENLRNAGFVYVTLDVSGYRTGSMIESLIEKEACVNRQSL
ncbi:tRNA-specific 2-thiouridylase MnmA [uncultured archaeon]|nr:tRNA-specific 2-thiouridylase MnmA [uncultured archaeon]